ncbi:MAG: DNA-binding protein [Candidatus Diapherotrites archaeon CG08_land_8_20_14_0_20_34_12]|nr:MAG: DNA-binding protein [Candidatus Diapherotrites archaeon CG08_land_8_20_14_0_20_34_12]
MKVNELIENRTLIRSKSTIQEIEGSLTIAERFLERAEGNLKIEYFDVAFSLAYQSMFHSARALLFKNNLKERSHAALINGLKELYAGEPELQTILQTMNSYRITRHAVQYSGVGCNTEDAEMAIKDAKEFIEIADRIISQLPTIEMVGL